MSVLAYRRGASAPHESLSKSEAKRLEQISDQFNFLERHRKAILIAVDKRLITRLTVKHTYRLISTYKWLYEVQDVKDRFLAELVELDKKLAVTPR